METDLSSAPSKGSAHQVAISVHINGVVRETRAVTLSALIEEAGYGDARVATAVNGAFVPARKRSTTALASGDHIEIVAPRQGG